MSLCNIAEDPTSAAPDKRSAALEKTKKRQGIIWIHVNMHIK